MKIVVATRIVVPKAYEQQLRELADEYYDDLPSAEEFGQRISQATILVCSSHIPITSRVIDAAPDLRYIIIPSVGYQSIDVEYAVTKGIKVLNCPTHNSQAVAEHAITLLLAANRKVIMSQTELRAGNWSDENFVGTELAGKILGLVGYGNIGTRIAAIASALGMQVQFVNSKSSDDELDTLLASSDFVCISVPLSRQTMHLLNERRLALLKPSAILVNVGRGAVIEQSALLELLKNRRIQAAALDVYENEPGNGQSPDSMIVELANLPNVTATSHIAYSTIESLEKLGKELIVTVQSAIGDNPISVITPR